MAQIFLGINPGALICLVIFYVNEGMVGLTKEKIEITKTYKLVIRGHIKYGTGLW